MRFPLSKLSPLHVTRFFEDAPHTLLGLLRPLYRDSTKFSFDIFKRDVVTSVTCWACQVEGGVINWVLTILRKRSFALVFFFENAASLRYKSLNKCCLATKISYFNSWWLFVLRWQVCDCLFIFRVEMTYFIILI